MKNLPLLKGKKIYLRGLSIQDAKGNYPNWLNDPEVTKYNSHGETLYTQKMAEEYISMVTESESHYVFAIIENTTEKHIGNISLQALDRKARNAEFAILIGETSVHAKGVGEEAGRLLLEYGFTELKLHRIYCGTSSDNIGMQKLALKLGMRQEGVRRDGLTKNGSYADIIEYGILEDEYTQETL
jgi:RimJ/RimL family protein N-acetyltransferase